jgi:tol-pal system-associated acyl-CoA thioesterase
MKYNHIFPVTVYYEDTDMTGLVYHPNYFKFFERARSEYFGGEELRRMQEEDGISVAVYRAEIVFKKGAVLGDRLEIHSQAEIKGDYRIVVQHKALRASSQELLVDATVELVCVAKGKLTRMPRWMVEKMA